MVCFDFDCDDCVRLAVITMIKLLVDLVNGLC